MRFQDSRIGMLVRFIPTGETLLIVGQRGVTPDGIATATDCGAWVEQTKPGPDGVKELWVAHWSLLEEAA